jgi:glycosyltransferase involved in cell wall biosynthesis
MTASSFVVLIPAYNPDEMLVSLAKQLVERAVPVVIVNDGSKADSLAVFGELAALAQVQVLSHDRNRGKGAALKTGLKHIMSCGMSCGGVVTADADGQHLLEDILRVGGAMDRRPNTLVLGARSFHDKVPARSLFGNRLTRWAFLLATGVFIRDTQTGLRGIPATAIPDCLALKSNRYEYEMEQLIRTCKRDGRIHQVPISCLYINDNKGSHFSPVADSLKIYFVFLRFASSALVSAAIDYIVFLLTYLFFGNLLASQYLARLISGTANYTINRKIVFKSDVGIRKSLTKYILLATFLAYIAYVIILGLIRIGVPVYLAKPMAEGGLFFFNFFVQKALVLRPSIQAYNNVSRSKAETESAPTRR